MQETVDLETIDAAIELLHEWSETQCLSRPELPIIVMTREELDALPTGNYSGFCSRETRSRTYKPSDRGYVEFDEQPEPREDSMSIEGDLEIEGDIDIVPQDLTDSEPDLDTAPCDLTEEDESIPDEP
jgi:hypothetical protein